MQEAKEEKFEEKLKEEKMPKDLSELLTFLDEMISVIKKMNMAEMLFHQLRSELQEKMNIEE
ncbi:MAG: hypothetical protein PWP07_255 [Epulopiscium sp.]|uniref:hypothetical protein n=1 Tax=Defluviitalea raffinosedens TaxID=1450156 RepID=UPI00175C3206|nr:hypothetical protein [Defluviitalea raffinosedens]MBM7684739.1 hypothetical protein [Defluviitalea raffinosedens]MBZ4668247.1 hypothetical protein [Defluviitaleaceae bacterium]MDK2787030.1 hypothetical protein [Candidatus Epulonipiscium sp.]HHW66969.1 hypothetical protein [Candidatus Epulonipiscium sp.]